MMNLKRPFAKDERGIAAVEFALLVPIISLVMVAVIEFSLRYQATDKFFRFSAQTGDYISRFDDITTSEIAAFYNQGPNLMRPVVVGDSLFLSVTSIGFRADTGEPVVLWQRNMNYEVFLTDEELEEAEDDPDYFYVHPVDLSEANGMGDPGETVIRIDAQYHYNSFISSALNFNSQTFTDTVFYRPRVTRVVSIDGQMAETNTDWRDQP